MSDAGPSSSVFETHARKVGERAADMIRYLSAENDRLRERIKQWEVFEVTGGPFTPETPEQELWLAMMDDARERGEVRLTVESRTDVFVGYVPTPRGSTVRPCWSCGHDTEDASGLCDPCTVASEHPSEKGSK